MNPTLTEAIEQKSKNTLTLSEGILIAMAEMIVTWTLNEPVYLKP